MSSMSIGVRLLHFTALALLGLFTQWVLTPPPRLEVVVPEGASVQASIEEALLLAEVERLGWIDDDVELRGRLVKVYREASGREHLDPDALFEEAKALGLHRSDDVVRLRLLARARHALSKVPNPDEATLQAHLAAHPDRFVAPPRYTVSFRHRTRDAHGASWPDVVGATARQAEPDTDPLPPALQSPVTLTESRLQARFGRSVALTIAQAPLSTWVGPVVTEDSAWFLRVDDVAPGLVPSFDRIRREVLADWSKEQGKQRAARVLENLSSQWQIEVVNP